MAQAQLTPQCEAQKRWQRPMRMLHLVQNLKVENVQTFSFKTYKVLPKTSPRRSFHKATHLFKKALSNWRGLVLRGCNANSCSLATPRVSRLRAWGPVIIECIGWHLSCRIFQYNDKEPILLRRAKPIVASPPMPDVKLNTLSSNERYVSRLMTHTFQLIDQCRVINALKFCRKI